MRILVISPYLPHARIDHGGGQAVRGLVRALGRRHDCLLLSLLRPGEQDLAPTVQELGVVSMTVAFSDRQARGPARWHLYRQRLLAIARTCRDRYPYFVAKYADRALTRAALAAAGEFKPDIIQIEYLQLAYLLRDLRRWRDRVFGGAAAGSDPRLILDSLEVSSLPRRRLAARAGGLRRRLLLSEAAAWDRLARDASHWADATLCVTEQDRRLLAAAGGQRLVTMPLGIETHEPPPDSDPHRQPRILFLGSFQHPPNRSAAALLCDRIWPQVCARLPDWQLVLAGPGSDAFLASRSSAAPRIVATGFVADLDALFAGCRLFAAPLTEGGGIKIKILEAMARSLPVVTTPIGIEGIAAETADLVWLAPDAESFAARLLAAAANPAEAARRAEQARHHVERTFGWDTAAQRLEAIYRDALAGRVGSP